MRKKPGGNVYGPFSVRSDPKKRRRALEKNDLMRRLSYAESLDEGSPFRRSSSPRSPSSRKGVGVVENTVAHWKNEFSLKDFQESILDLISNSQRLDQYQIAERIRKTVSGIRRRVTDLIVSMTDLMRREIDNNRRKYQKTEDDLHKVVNDLTNQLTFQKQRETFLTQRNQDLNSRIKTYQRQIREYKRRLGSKDQDDVIMREIVEHYKRTKRLSFSSGRNSNRKKDRRKGEYSSSLSETSSSEEERTSGGRGSNQRTPKRGRTRRTPLKNSRGKKRSPPLRIEDTSDESDSDSSEDEEIDRDRREISHALDRVIDFEKRNRRRMRRVSSSSGNLRQKGRRKKRRRDARSPKLPSTPKFGQRPAWSSSISTKKKRTPTKKRTPAKKKTTRTPRTPGRRKSKSPYRKKKKVSPVRKKKRNGGKKKGGKSSTKKKGKKGKTGGDKTTDDSDDYFNVDIDRIRRKSNARKISITSLIRKDLGTPDVKKLNADWVFKPSKKLKEDMPKREETESEEEKEEEIKKEEVRKGIEEESEESEESEEDSEEDKKKEESEEEEEEDEEAKRMARIKMMRSRRGRTAALPPHLMKKKQQQQQQQQQQEEEEEEKESSESESSSEEDEESEDEEVDVETPSKLQETKSEGSSEEVKEAVIHDSGRTTFLRQAKKPSPKIRGSHSPTEDDEVVSPPVQSPLKRNLFSEQLKKYGPQYLGKSGDVEDLPSDEESDSEEEVVAAASTSDEDPVPSSPPRMNYMKMRPNLSLKKKKVLKIHHQPVEVLTPIKPSLMRAESFDTRDLPLHRRAMLQHQKKTDGSYQDGREQKLNQIQSYISKRNQRQQQQQDGGERPRSRYENTSTNASVDDEEGSSEDRSEEGEDSEDSEEDSDEDVETDDSNLSFPSLSARDRAKSEEKLVKGRTSDLGGGMSITLSTPKTEDENMEKSDYDTSDDDGSDEDSEEEVMVRERKDKSFNEPQPFHRNVKINEEDVLRSSSEEDSDGDEEQPRKKMKIPAPKIDISPPSSSDSNKFEKFKPSLKPLEIIKSQENRVTCPSPKEIVEDLVKQHGVPKWKEEKIKTATPTSVPEVFKKVQEKEVVPLGQMVRTRSMSEIKEEIRNVATIPDPHEPVKSPLRIEEQDEMNDMKFPKIRNSPESPQSPTRVMNEGVFDRAPNGLVKKKKGIALPGPPLPIPVRQPQPQPKQPQPTVDLSKVKDLSQLSPEQQALLIKLAQQQQNSQSPQSSAVSTPVKPNPIPQKLPSPAVGANVVPKKTIPLPLPIKVGGGRNPSPFVHRPFSTRRMSLDPSSKPGALAMKKIIAGGAMKRGLPFPIKRTGVGIVTPPVGTPTKAAGPPKPFSPGPPKPFTGGRVMSPMSPMSKIIRRPSVMYSKYSSKSGVGAPITSSRNNILQAMNARRNKRSMSMYAQSKSRGTLGQF